MFSVAELLDRAKVGGNIESDYRLSKVIGIKTPTMSGYRAGKTMPDARVLEQLCALSGDDVAVVMAQIQAERERTTEGRAMWLMVAKRLAGGATTAILSVCFAIALVAGYAQPVGAAQRPDADNAKLTSLYIVSNAFLTATAFILVRLRRCAGVLRLCFAASLA